MPSHLARALMRRTQALRPYARNASTTAEVSKTASETAQKAQNAAGNVASKASEGLSKVKSSAESTVSNAAQSASQTASSAASGVSGRVGKLVGFVQSLVPPTVYYSKVGLELARLIAKDRKMAIPDISAFQSYFQPLLSNIRTPSALLNATSSSASSLNPNTIISQVRNLNNQQLVAVGIATAEVIGFFTVGQMIGRLKIVGYRTSGHAHGGEH